ncbi:rhomboid family intramembrane serine protease [Maribacter algarum]|uniref:Rhomboid family intramembrane serine protease n=1 Tax=Maribacter algarum (ex Zhang et al. 2020) TaxID=2578118 RepID=A0A5S3Q9X5_9FLAO|nr:rhomboid family intramembrane serine protease [Maribacter algarum]TMM53853.1 rhomboid family intramembrane serine protease [Maribacter algarum]
MKTGGLRYQYARLSIAEKLIAINVAVYIVNYLVPFLFKLHPDSISQWFWLPKSLLDFFSQPWSIVTYSFFHADFWHILMNMLILYFASRILLNLFDGKKFLNIYFLGVIAGGTAFLLSYNIFPAFLENTSQMIGASAGVMAVLIFICTYIPNQEIRLIFFNVKLWYIGAFFVLKDLIQIPMGNAGGHIAHLGGALLGYMYARKLMEGRDIGAGFSKFLDGLANLFKTKEKKAPMKTVYKNRATSQSKVKRDKDSHQRQIDTILDKISKSGYESLSKAEKDFLFKAGKED